MKKMRMAAGVLAVLLACRAVPFGNAEAAGVEMKNLEILETGQKIQSRKSVSKPGYETVCSAEQKIPQTEQTDSAAEADKEGISLSPYATVLVGPKEIDPLAGTGSLLGVQNTTDLEALEQYIKDKQAAFRESMAEKLEQAGILREQQNFVSSEGERVLVRQILAMTAVFRGYTFYNRIVCQWYADNLWNETFTYQVTGSDGQKGAAAGFLIYAASVAGQLGMDGNAVEVISYNGAASLFGHDKITINESVRSREELYQTDACALPIPVDWAGWTEEKQAECEELLAMDEETFYQTLKTRQEESLLSSPVPFYKQGAVEWGSQSFGNGTLSGDACCPTAIAMVLSYFKNQRITPAEVAARYDNDAYRNREQGSYGGKMCAAAAADYGLQAETGVDSLSGKQIREALESGAKIVMSMKPGDNGGRYASVYHYVTLAGLTEDGKVIVNNPGISTDVTYDDMETILKNQSGRGYGIFRK